MPAFDGGLWHAGSSSFTSTSDEALLVSVRPAVRQWFDRYIGTRLGTRNLWAAGLLADEPEGAIWIDAVVRLDDDGTIDRSAPTLPWSSNSP